MIRRRSARPDWTGGILAAAALAALTYGLIEGPAQHWKPAAVVGARRCAVALLAGFIAAGIAATAQPDAAARRCSAPASSTRPTRVTFAMYGALSAFLFLLPVQLQTVAGYTPLASGISLLPLTVLMLLLSARSGALAARIGPRLQMSVGPLLLAARNAAAHPRRQPTRNYLTTVLPAAFVVGLGLSTTVAPLTAAALSTVPPENAGHRVRRQQRRRPHSGPARRRRPARARRASTATTTAIARSFNHGFDRAAVICAGLALPPGCWPH